MHNPEQPRSFILHATITYAGYGAQCYRVRHIFRVRVKCGVIIL
jgi:hypothetical protein